jgi:lipid II:glycine glycyltransferase (peptidoglycan interpeptide bridge formation enzyme)
MNIYNDYFNQNNEWVMFWESIDNKNKCRYFSNQHFQCYVYQFTNFLGFKYWYIPKGPTLKFDNTCTKEKFYQFLNHIHLSAKNSNISFIKIDFDDNLTNYFKFNINLEIKQSNFLFNIIKSNKSIQYLKSMVLDCKKLNIACNYLDFYNCNLFFWNQRSNKVKRYTRLVSKLADQGIYTISFEKSKSNLDAFYFLHKLTSENKKFPTHKYEYFEKFIQQKFSRLLVIYKNNKPVSCWLGPCLNNTFYYLFGGNSLDSYKEHIQYLTHIAIIKKMSEENIDSYDLGGYEETEGYGIFKTFYNGSIREFQGSYDIIVNKYMYLFEYLFRLFKK